MSRRTQMRTVLWILQDKANDELTNAPVCTRRVPRTAEFPFHTFGTPTLDEDRFYQYLSFKPSAP